MFKKIFVVFLFVMAFGAFSLEAAMSKSEASSMFKKIISEKWNRKYFSTTSNKAFANGSWKYGKSQGADWAVFNVTKVFESGKYAWITGNFEDEDGLEEDDETIFKMEKKNGMWKIQLVTIKSGKKTKVFNFNKNCFEPYQDIDLD